MILEEAWNESVGLGKKAQYQQFPDLGEEEEKN